MPYPTLHFTFDPEFDADLAWLFYSDPEYGGANFWEKGVTPYHEGLKNLNRRQNKKSYLKTYTLKLYKKNSEAIHERGREIQESYEKKKFSFYKEADRIFHRNRLKGRYTAYFSIFDFCPRFLNEKSFFVFLSQNDEDALFTIFHELLHFYFYHYCVSKYPKIFKQLNTESGPFWEIAELFNGVVMQTSALSKIYGKNPSFGYPGLQPAFKQARRKWNDDINQWMEEFAIPYIINKLKRSNT